MYFIRGVNNTLKEFDAEAVSDSSCCRLEIPLDLAACVICECKKDVKCTHNLVLQSLTVDELEDNDYCCDC